MKIQEKNIKWITMGILAISAGMIALGVGGGEVRIVLAKATSICMQCIGIG